MNKIETNELIKKLKTMKLELMDLSLLKPDPLNVKTHPKEQVERIAQSMQKRWTNPILVDDNRYCDVIVRRWQDFAKKQAVREKDGVTFDEAEERPYVGVEQE